MRKTIILEKRSFKEIVQVSINENTLIIGTFNLNHGAYERTNIHMEFQRNKTTIEALFESYTKNQHQIDEDNIPHPIKLMEVKL